VTRSKLIKGYLFVILSAVLYGLMPLMTTHIKADGANAYSLVFLRNALSLPALAALALMQQKTLKVPLREVPTIALAALFGCCITPVLLYCSYDFMDSGTATVLHFVYPALVVLGGVIFLKQRPAVGTLLSVLVCVGGIALFLDPNAAVTAEGSILSLLSGLTFACYVLMLSAFPNRKASGFVFTFYVALVCTIVMGIYCAATGSMALPRSPMGWILCFIFALLINAVATVLFQQGTFIVGGQRASILSTMEPITGVVVGALLLNEFAGKSAGSIARTVVGSILVVAATVMIALFDSKKK